MAVHRAALGHGPGRQVDIGYIKATGHSVKFLLPRTSMKPEVEFEWKVPQWSNAIERDRAGRSSRSMRPARLCTLLNSAMKELHAGRTKTWTDFKVPDNAIGCGFHEAVRGVVASHGHPRRQDRQLPPLPANPLERQPAHSYGTPGPYEDAVQGTPIFEENGPDKFKGIDIMRAGASFDPRLPCGVHMYLGDGKTLEDAPFADVRFAALIRFKTAKSLSRREKDYFAVLLSSRTQAGRFSWTIDNSSSKGFEQIEERVRALEEMPDPCVRTQVVELVQGIMQLHAVGLEQMLDIIRRTGAAGDDIVDRFTRDSLASGLLLLHDLHPVPFAERVTQAVEKVRPLLKSHGGDVELLGIDEGVVRLRLVGNCNGCPSSG